MLAEQTWIAECQDCDWFATSAWLRRVDLKADLHAAQTGHRTDLDQSE